MKNQKKSKIFGFCIILLLVLSSFSFAETNAKKIENSSKDISIEMKANNDYSYKASDVVFTVTSSKTGKKWDYTAEEWIKIKLAAGNWDVVEQSDPRIKDVYEDDNYLYIVFGYSTVTPREFFGIQISKKDDYILSGKILIHKKYLINDNMQKCEVTFYKNASIGLLIYSILTTVLCVILAL